MATEILMPALSPTMDEGALAKWHVKEGDRVRRGDVICEVETDKTTMEVEAAADGVLARILAPEGAEDVKVGAAMAVILAAGEDPAEAALREMDEEIGVAAKLVDVLEETEDWLYYDFPPDLLRRMGGPYLGQRQKWFALRFKGSDSDVRLDKHTPEFDAWRWAKLEELPSLIVPFKRPVYEEVAKRFEPWSTPV